MKVILLRDVAKLGYKNDVVEVANGYGLNKLIPQGLAKMASDENLKAVHAQAEKSESMTAASSLAFAELTAALEGASIVITKEANEDGRLFEAVKADEIAAAVEKATGKSVLAQQVVLGDPVKTVGEHVTTIASGAESQKVTFAVEAA